MSANNAPENHDPTPTPANNQQLPTNSPLNHLLPEGTLTLLLGDPGTGKSLLALHLAALLSQGIPLPPLNPLNSNPHSIDPPASATSLLLSPEDPLPIRAARAKAAGANVNYLLGVDDHCTLHTTPPAPSSLVSGLIEALPHFDNLKLLILDPLPALLGTKDCSSQATIRALLSPLLQLAATHKFAILGISHLNKRLHLPSLYRALGSLAYTSLARTIYLLTPEPPADHSPLATCHANSRRLLIPLKHNLSSPTHARAFTITENQFGPILHWEQNPIPLHTLPANLQSPAQPAEEDPLEQSRLELARTYLQTTLQNGPVLSATLQREANSIGIATRTLFRARGDLKIPTYHDGKTGKWLCALPGQIGCSLNRQGCQSRAHTHGSLAHPKRARPSRRTRKKK